MGICGSDGRVAAASPKLHLLWL